ncbi:phenylacetic acid degradation protein paaN [Crossiella equi]|uniref:Phenylacetic acid degradation protein paaN n=1 Tax=Crossiella equi TaxID=130796 RepID=A0ABS5A879_9PSEU|nr:phenylacetic acid degradation protein PaaN [Crossiella equi]MBP2472457.1 phenylacetic acid degradation protein paaN [Crossiella equi]
MSAQDFHARHAELLDRAVEAIDTREYYSPFPEVPSRANYGEQAATEGEAAFQAVLGQDFPLDQPGFLEYVATEKSPHGLALGVRYPRCDPAALVEAAKAGRREWRDAGPSIRAGVAIEVLSRLNARSFEIAHATQHTTGQSFVMAFQSGGPHAQERGLEAIAYAYAEQTRQPRSARWHKPAKGGALVLDKTYTVVPRGIALVVACNTFPTWNGYPGLFASLVTGNPVIVKPHPLAVLPLALTVAVAREVLAEAGFDPNLVTLAVEAPDEPIAAELATHPDVRIVDFTGSTEFGNWLEANARQAVVYTEKSGLNTVVVDSTDDYPGLLRNLAHSLSLYSGQMCTTPQNILVPRNGITTEVGQRSPEQFAADLGAAMDTLLADPVRAANVLGALVNDGVRERVREAERLGPLAHATLPLVVRLDAAAEQVYTREWFGPVSFVVTTDSTAHSLDLLRRTVRAKGALTAAVYSTSDAVVEDTREAALEAGVHLSENLTQGIFVNQAAAFSDFHGTGANPAATAALTDPAYVTGRFAVVQSRRHVTEG